MIAEPVGRRDGGEERVEPGLDRVLAKQPLGDLLVGPDPQRFVRVGERDLGAVAHHGAGRSRAAEQQDPLGTDPVVGQRAESLASSALGATRSCRTLDQQWTRPVGGELAFSCSLATA